MTDLISKSEELLKNYEKNNKFINNFNANPVKKTYILYENVKELADSIQYIDSPRNYEELINSELKRILNGVAYSISRNLVPTAKDYNSIVDNLGIPKQDINDLKPWLLDNKTKTNDLINELSDFVHIDNYHLPINADIPEIREKAIKFASVNIDKYHAEFGDFLQNLTNAGSFLKNIKAVPTTADRSYFNSLMNFLALSISKICYTSEDNELHLDEKGIIRLYGHEGMGHALNQSLTNNSDIPYFLKKSDALHTSTKESVAQFYEKQIMEDLKNNKDLQERLGISDKFDKMYNESLLSTRIEEYNRKLFQYAITVLADTSLGHPQDRETVKKKIELLSEVSLSPLYPRDIIENYKYQFDSEGNLNSNVVQELIYCAQPVKRALEEFAKQGIKYEGKERSLIDTTFLTGFWTPVGFVDNARLVAEKNSKLI